MNILNQVENITKFYIHYRIAFFSLQRFQPDMASYFDEHDCLPLGQGEIPDHILHFARLLIDTGAWNQVNNVIYVA